MVLLVTIRIDHNHTTAYVVVTIETRIVTHPAGITVDGRAGRRRLRDMVVALEVVVKEWVPRLQRHQLVVSIVEGATGKIRTSAM